MSCGVIGLSAHEIYTLPRSAYVARFMGGQNVLGGKVAAVANGIATLVNESGEHYAMPMEPDMAAAQETVFCTIRRDRVEVATTPQGAADTPGEPNAVCGTVHTIEYQGSYVKVSIRRPGHEDFVANLDDSAFFAQQLDIGDRVVARWSVEDVHLLRPERSREQGRAAVDRPYGEEFDRPPR